MRRFRGAALLFCLIAVVAAIVPTGAGASSRVRLRSSAARFASSSALVRRPSAGQRISFQVYLGFRDRAGAERLLRHVSNPDSRTYTNYLSPQAFRTRFSRSSADLATVRSWLESQGLRVTGGPASRLWLDATGTTAQIDRTFGVRLGYYRTAQGVVRAPDRAPAIPSSLRGLVRGVDLIRTKIHRAALPPPPGGRDGRPCSQFWGRRVSTNTPKAYGDHQPLFVCGYTPQQLQGAYGMRSAINSGTDGSGTTVAILGSFGSPTMQQDLDKYSQRHGLPQQTITQVVDPTDPGWPVSYQQGWWFEQVLDIQAVHSMAPGADIFYRGTANPYFSTSRKAFAEIVDGHLADIVTNSWGIAGEVLSGTQVNLWHDLFVEAGGIGIGTYFSSGDCGDNLDPDGLCGGAGYRTVDYPTSDPAVTSVGGTSLGVGPTDNWLFELGWGTTASEDTGSRWAPKPPGVYIFGSGGGTSRIFSEPGYQNPVVPEKLSAWWGGANRVVPDIAAVGDPYTGFINGMTQRFPGGDHYAEYASGGTSLSSPLMAGMMALADDAAGFAHGFANPALYGLAGTSAFHDVVTPHHLQALVRTRFVNGLNAKDGVLWGLRTMNQTGTLHTRPGYDDVTGNGTPNGQQFLNALS